MRSCSERSMPDTTAIVSSDERGLFFLTRVSFNLALRKCSQYAAGSTVEPKLLCVRQYYHPVINCNLPLDRVMYIDRPIFIVCFIGILVCKPIKLKVRLCILLTRRFEWVPWLIRIRIIGRYRTTHYQTIHVLG
jgi:hypothetical protein